MVAAPPVQADELVVDLRPRPPLELQHDGGADARATVGPALSYRTVGPRNLERIQLAPWPPVQGQTLVVHVQARSPVTFSLSFLGRPFRVLTFDGNGWALVPIPPLQKAVYTPLTVRAGEQQLVVNVPIVAGKFETINIPASTATPILSETTKVNSETSRMMKLFAGVTKGGWNPRSRFTPPLQGEFVHTSRFGSRRTYGKNPALSAHAGEDYSAPPGTPVYAPAEGKVVLAEKLFVRGNAVVLDHGNGVFTGYWHLSELGVKPGARVNTGQLLGKVGSTGLSTGAHLHWEMRVAGMAVDPMQWLAARSEKGK